MSDSLSDRIDALAAFVERLDVSPPPQPVPEADFRWAEIDRQIGGRIEGRRVLVIEGDVAADADAFAKRGAAYVLACPSTPGVASGQDGRDAVDHRTLVWQELDPVAYGSFDVVLCSGLLYRVAEPLTLLRALRSMTVDGGTLLISSMLIDDPERSEYLRFVPDGYAGDPDWCFVPGRLAFRWMVEAVGFDVEAEFAEQEGPRDLFPVVSGYLKATARC